MFSESFQLYMPVFGITSSRYPHDFLNSFKYLDKWHQLIMPSAVIKKAFPDHSAWNNTSFAIPFCPLPTVFFSLVLFITWQIELFFLCAYYPSFYNVQDNRHLVCFAKLLFLVPWTLFLSSVSANKQFLMTEWKHCLRK